MARTKLYPPSVDPAFPELPPSPPEGWARTSFEDVINVIERPMKLEPTGVYRLLTAKRNRGGITLRSELLGREILTKTQFEAKAGDFLISRRQIIHGACGVVPDDLDGAVVSNEYSTLRTKSTLLMPFLEHYSHTPYFQRTCFHSSHGVDVEKMIFKIDEWLARDVDVPPVPEQRKIAAILSSVDDAIEATQAVIDQLQVVKKAMMAELLTRGLPGRHTKFKMTQIGEVPEEWEVERVGALGEVKLGRMRSPVYVAGTLRPYLRVANVLDDAIDSTDVLEMPFEVDQFETFRLRDGDILLNEGQSLQLVGRSAIYRGDPPDCAFQKTLLRFRAGPKLHTEFTQQLFQSWLYSGRFAEHAVQTTSIAHLTGVRFTAMSIAVPGLEEQIEISHMLATVADRHRIERDAHRALTALKSALMSVLLTGEVRVAADAGAV